jgi:hypothetical protein
MQNTMYNPNSGADPGAQPITLQRVPLGYEDLEAGNFDPIQQEDVLKMIRAYGDKLASGRPAPAPADPKQQAAAPEDTRGCWFCVDVFLKLMGIEETEDTLKEKGLMDKDVSGIRIYFARSGNRDTVVMLSTEREPEPGKVRTDPDRMGPGQRVVYVDDKHKNPDGGSICPPPYT